MIVIVVVVVIVVAATVFFSHSINNSFYSIIIIHIYHAISLKIFALLRIIIVCSYFYIPIASLIRDFALSNTQHFFLFGSNNRTKKNENTKSLNSW